MRETSNPVRVAFGTFEADLSTGELWRGGFRIKLQGQPFRVLAELVQHAGHVVTREELQQRVWDKGTNVDFDHSLGTAVNKIRDALGDNAENPRYVETLTRRGYRFIAPVTVLDLPEAPAPLIPTAVLETPSESASTLHAGSSDGSLAPEQSTGSFSAPAGAPPASAGSQNGKPDPVRDQDKSSVQGQASTQHPSPISDRIQSRLAQPRFRWLQWILAAAIVLLASAASFLAGLKHSFPLVPSLRQITHTQRVLPGGDAMEVFPVTVTDGLHLFASVIRDGSVHLERISIAGGESEAIVVPDEIAGPAIADISHDGSRLLVRSHASNQSEQPLFIVPTRGWSAQRVVRVLAHDATWMPEDTGILYAAGNELFVAPLNGDAPVRYASLPGRAFWLRWSPDGKLLRFTLFDPLTHTQALWELSANNHTAHPVLPDWSESREVCCGSWFADGSGFLFQSSAGTSSDLWILHGRSSHPVRLTDGPLAYQGPVTARSGRTVYLTGVSSTGEVQLLHPGAHEFIPVRGFYSDAHRLEQTRDGKWFAWVDTEGRLWRARSDGSELLQLTPGHLQVFTAHWSPDGSRIALMARMASGAWSIYQELADGSDLQPLLQTGSNAADPTWSPDGQKIVLGQAPDLMGKDGAPRTIQILDLKSRSLTTLPGSRDLFSPRWSPDGRTIAAMSLDQKQLRLYDVASGQWRVLSNRSAADPVWASDSRSLYADAFMDPGQPVYRVSIADGHIEELGGIANFRTPEFSDLVLCGVLGDGTIAVRARITTANLYALHLESHS